MFKDILNGVTVVDFTHLGAGPMCTMLLGDMGADVLKVEAPGGELGRRLGPGWIGDDCTAYYGFNRNKRSISINLKDAKGRDIAQRMIAKADVVVESLRPGVMKKLGLDYESMSRINPSLVYCSISAYGQDGPYAQRAGVDGILQADCGLMSIIGNEDAAEPSKVQAPVVDVTTGYIACLAVMAKLFDVRKSGKGGYIDVNLMNSALTLQQTSLTNYLSEQVVPEKMGSAAPYSAPNEAFSVQDGWLMVAAYNGTRWADLCNVLGAPELSDDVRFATSPDRVRNRKAMRDALNRIFIRHPASYWLDKLLAADILCAKVADYDELVRHPQVLKNNILPAMHHPVFGAIRTVGFPVNSEVENSRQHALPPACGEHSSEILSEWGYSPEDIAMLYTEKVIF